MLVMFSGIIFTCDMDAGRIFLYMAAVGRGTATISQLFKMLIGMNPMC